MERSREEVSSSTNTRQIRHMKEIFLLYFIHAFLSPTLEYSVSVLYLGMVK